MDALYELQYVMLAFEFKLLQIKFCINFIYLDKCAHLKCYISIEETIQIMPKLYSNKNICL